MESHQHNNGCHNETHQQDKEQRCEAQPFCCDNEVVISIEEKIRELPPIAEECCIYRVPKRLFNMNPPAYTPQIISIGPFHHGKEDFVDMEQHKLRFLDCYLRHTNICVKDAFDIARTWEEQARKCYAEPINMNSKKFVEMMLVDGCFIVEYLITFYNGRPRNETQNRLDTHLYFAICHEIHRDLIMLENQLPFFILRHLFNLLPHNEEEDLSLIQLAHNFLSHGLINTCESHHLVISTQEVKHMVDFLSFNFVPLPGTENNSENPNLMLSSAVTELYCMACVKMKKPTEAEDNSESSGYTYPPTVTELHEAGVKIKRAAKEKCCLMDISFKDGVLEIPHFEIDDCYETTMRNMMAYEHYNVQSDRKYVIQYISFLDDLISTKEDVRILVKKGIITNSIGGSNEEVAKLFNDLCKEVLLPNGPNWHFDHINQDLRNHCEKLWNYRMASLRHNYCSTPWATISIFGAISLLILTFLQTLFSSPSFKTK